MIVWVVMDPYDGNIVSLHQTEAGARAFLKEHYSYCFYMDELVDMLEVGP